MFLEYQCDKVKFYTEETLDTILYNLDKVEETQEQAVTKEMALIDFDEVLEFYRGNALIDTVGAQSGITSEKTTKFFETNDYHELMDEEK